MCVFSCIIFCCRSANGRELLASSLDGSISYMCFAKDEIGEPMKMEEVVSVILLSMLLSPYRQCISHSKLKISLAP